MGIPGSGLLKKGVEAGRQAADGLKAKAEQGFNATKKAVQNAPEPVKTVTKAAAPLMPGNLMVASPAAALATGVLMPTSEAKAAEPPREAAKTGPNFSIDAIEQGDLGNCQTLAYIAAKVETDPGFFENRIEQTGEDEWQVTMPASEFTGGVEKTISVSRKDLEGHNVDKAKGSEWVPVYSAAIDKLMIQASTDQALKLEDFTREVLAEGNKKGASSYILSELFGDEQPEGHYVDPTRLNIPDVPELANKYKKDDGLKEIDRALASGEIVVASAEDDPFNLTRAIANDALDFMGRDPNEFVYTNHAYAVLDKSEQGGVEGYTIFNPHGDEFFMSKEEFQKSFDSFVVAD